MIKRILTAIPLVALGMAISLWENPVAFIVVCIAALTTALYEVYIMLENRGMKAFKLSGIIFGLVIYGLIIMNYSMSGYFFATALFVIGLFFQIVISKKIETFPKFINTFGPVTYIATLGSFGLLLRDLPHGNYLIFTLFYLTYFYDAGAYFFGTFFGKHKLIPELSPGKTVEGSMGGIVINILFSLILANFILPKGMFGNNAYIHCVILAVLMSFFGQIGDIAASVVKRYAGVKNSSNLLPGHGGALDRIDSAMFNAPVLYFYFKYIIMG